MVVKVARRVTLWTEKRSLAVVPVKHDASRYSHSRNHYEWQSYVAKCDAVRANVGKPTIVAKPGRTRDRSRDALKQSGGYVMSGWGVGSKAGVSTTSKRLTGKLYATYR